jgi:hypothetical protein
MTICQIHRKSLTISKNRKLFKNTFSSLSNALPEGIKRGNRKTTPYNLYEAISVGAADAIEEGEDLANKNVDVWIDDSDLKGLTSGATNSRPKLKARIKYCFDRFMGNV